MMNSLLAASIRTRRVAAEALEAIMRNVLESDEPVSEAMLCERWLKKLREHSELYPDGWYTPPPHGMFVQFGTDVDPSRLYRETNRPSEAWPRDDIFLDRSHSIINVYASPVDRETGMIGDFSTTLYFGRKPEVQSLLRQRLELEIDLFEAILPDMAPADIVEKALGLMADAGWHNAIMSINDPAGTNIGHSFPASDTGWSKEEMAIISSGDWEAAANLISKRRLFISLAETSPIPPNFIYTIEPRPTVPDRPDLPMTCFHALAVWEDGRKQFVTNFDRLFTLAGMDYMPKTGQMAQTEKSL